jgi:hypothetical protein
MEWELRLLVVPLIRSILLVATRYLVFRYSIPVFFQSDMLITM